MCFQHHVVPVKIRNIHFKNLPFIAPKIQAVPDDLVAGRELKFNEDGNPYYEEENIEITFDLGSWNGSNRPK